MSIDWNNYLIALEETRKYLEPSIGLCNYNVSPRADSEIIKQNNVIIQILIQLNNKLEQQDHWIKLLEEEREHDDKIDSLIAQINNLKLGENNKRTQKKQRDLIFGKI